LSAESFTKGATFSTHVLDVGAGAPVAGVRVTLSSSGAGGMAGVTGIDGRLEMEGELEPGLYTLRFDIRGHFAVPHMFDEVAFEVRLDEARHYHVPLLVAPFGASSYRGS
jgi:5-hydroxyisourate hydrolase